MSDSITQRNCFFSVDQSLSKCSIIIWVDDIDDYSCILKTGASKVKKKLKSVNYFDTIEEQIHFICEGFVDLVKEFKPEAIVFEGLSFASAGDATRNLAGLFHCLIERVHSDCGIPLSNIHKVAPTTLKKFARGYLPEQEQRVGAKLCKMDKKMMVRAAECAGGGQWLDDLVMSASSERGGKDDVADAYLMGLYFKNKIRGEDDHEV